jgi:hypothetical protein
MGNKLATVADLDSETLTVAEPDGLPQHPFFAQLSPSRVTPLPGAALVEVVSPRRDRVRAGQVQVLERALQETSGLTSPRVGACEVGDGG